MLKEAGMEQGPRAAALGKPDGADGWEGRGQMGGAVGPAAAARAPESRCGRFFS